MKSRISSKQATRILREMIPHASLEDFHAIRETMLQPHFRLLPASIAAWQAITSRARHAHTEYDTLLEEGYDRDAARHFVLDDMNRQLLAWGCSRQVCESDED